MNRIIEASPALRPRPIRERERAVRRSGGERQAPLRGAKTVFLHGRELLEAGGCIPRRVR
ncbi:MAG TPA: hypothetical protein VF418_11610 [Sphingomonadaceae bacterium]